MLVVQSVAHSEYRIDTIISGNKAFIRRYALPPERLRGVGRRSEMPCGEAGGQDAGHLFREWLPRITRAQARFDMRHFNALIESLHSRGQPGGGIALNNPQLRTPRVQDRRHSR